MKVLFVNGSSHKNGTTMQAVKEMQKVFESQSIETEVIQLGNKPIYYAHPSGRILSFLDRVFYAAGSIEENPFKFKPGASVAVARRGGTTASFDVLNKYFGISEMPIAGSTYWNISHGAVAEDAAKDLEGMQTMRNLAKNMIWMMRSFALAKENGIPYPDTKKDVHTNFIR